MKAELVATFTVKSSERAIVLRITSQIFGVKSEYSVLILNCSKSVWQGEQNIFTMHDFSFEKSKDVHLLRQARSTSTLDIL